MDAPQPDAVIGPRRRREGRPPGSRNYGARSHIARRMKERGISWVDDMIDCYALYKAQAKAQFEDPSRPDPSPLLLEYWAQVLPYITVKMIERETRRERPATKYKPRITPQAIARLTAAEGRKP